jgi:reactive intermediate/imine deaminase
MNRHPLIPLAVITLSLVGASSSLVEAQEAVAISKLPFSAARKAGGTLYISGQISRNVDGEDVRESVAAETRTIMDNIGRILKDNGYGFEDLVSVTVYLRDILGYHEMNAAYRDYFENGVLPTRACVGGAQIVFDFKVEISAIAYKEE